MHTLRTFIRRVDQASSWMGRAVSWLTLALVLLTFAVVLLRYAFDLGWIAMQESITYLHAALFMLGAAYTLQSDDHVRVDIFYRPLTARGQAWVNLLGTLFLLLPVCLFIGWISWAYVASSWVLREGSHEAGGLDLVWLLKTLLLLMPALLALQGLANGGRALLTLLTPKAP